MRDREEERIVAQENVSNYDTIFVLIFAVFYLYGKLWLMSSEVKIET